MKRSVTLRPMSPIHIDEVVKVHLASFPGYFLSFLGPSFLRLFYEGILDDPGGIALVVTSPAGRIEGFAAGVLQQAGFYSRLIRKRIWTFAAASLTSLMRRPSIMPRLLRALRRPAESTEAAADACLMSIAVRPDAESMGLGGRLIEGFCLEVSRRGAPGLCLTTDQHKNERANRFYRRWGFRIHRTYVTPEGRTMNEYVRVFDQDE
jgi:GNAT superfamily N-acetyltransferase